MVRAAYGRRWGEAKAFARIHKYVIVEGLQFSSWPESMSWEYNSIHSSTNSELQWKICIGENSNLNIDLCWYTWNADTCLASVHQECHETLLDPLLSALHQEAMLTGTKGPCMFSCDMVQEFNPRPEKKNSYKCIVNSEGSKKSKPVCTSHRWAHYQ